MAFTPNASGHVLTFIFGTFFLVMMVMTLIYVVYYDDRHIPRFIALVRHRHFIRNRSDVTFARLHVKSRGEGDDASVIDENEVDLHFASDQSIEQLNQSFNNPMFDQNIAQQHRELSPSTTSNDDEVEKKKKA
jgi:hypothetical protein